MNFSLVPTSVLIIGGVLLAAAVTALSLLKVRRRRVALASAVLWQQALRETPPRLLGGRFRRPLAWLLSLLLVLLLWLVSGGPVRAPSDDGRLHVFYLDASAWLQADGAFDAARSALEHDVAQVPSSSREVVLGGQVPARIAAPGEAAALLHARLADVHAVTAPSGFQRWLQQTAARVGDGAGIVVHYYGAAPIARRAATQLPAGITLEPSHLAEPVARNAGIVALGASRAASGRWDAVDVLVSTDAVGMPRPDVAALRWTLDDASWTPPTAVRSVDGDLLFADVPATGGLLRVSVRDTDMFPVDDSAALRLPLRTPVSVALGATVPAMVADAVRVDPSLRVVEGTAQAQVQMLAAGDAARPDVPVLWLDAEDAGAAFRFVAPDDAAQDEIVAGLGALGLDQARNTALANELGRAVGVDVVAGPQRGVHVWRALFAADGSFVQSRAMPVFVNRSLHWLADEPWSSPYAAAGAPLRQELLQGLGQQDALRMRALGDQVMLPEAGLHTVAGQQLAVSLLDRQITRGVAGDVTAAASRQEAAPGWRWPSLVFLMLACALGLVCVEWVLLQRGRMP